MSFFDLIGGNVMQPESYVVPTSGGGWTASVRNNNPGAMWPNPVASQFGSTGFQNLRDGQGNKIATFPDAISGAAAQFALLSKNYTGMPLSAAIQKWSGGNSSPQYTQAVANATGLSPNTVLTPQLLASPQGVELAKAMARQEAGGEYPLSQEGWQQAQARAFGNSQTIGGNGENVAGQPSQDDQFASAMGGKGTSMPPVLQIQQQNAQAPIDLTDEGPSYKQLADALLAAGQSMGQTAHTPWQALGSIAQILSGTYQGEKAKQAEKDYTARLMSALQGAGGDASSFARILAADPQTRAAGIGMLAKAFEPKEQKWSMIQPKDQYDRPIGQPLMMEEHSGATAPIGSPPSRIAPSYASPSGGAVPVAASGAPVVSSAPAAPSAPMRDAPTVVHSETYLPDGTKVEPPAAAPSAVPAAQPASISPGPTVANPFAMIDGSTSPAPPRPPVPGSPPPAASEALEPGQYVGGPAMKVPPGYTQRRAPDGQFLYSDPEHNKPIFDLTADVTHRAELAAKKADTEATQLQGYKSYQSAIDAARNIADMPGFEDALRYNNQVSGPSVHREGISVGLGYGGLLRGANPTDPMWAAHDRINQLATELQLSGLARLKAVGGNRLTNLEFQTVGKMTGDIAKATSPADFQFRLNSYNNYVNRQVHILGNAEGAPPSPPSSPTNDEINRVASARSDEDRNGLISALSQKYNTKPKDMQDYIASVRDSKRTATDEAISLYNKWFGSPAPSSSAPVGAQTAPSLSTQQAPALAATPQTKMQDRISQAAPPAPPPAQAAPASPSQPPTPPLNEAPGVTAKPVTTKAEFDALPSKAIFIAPDGTVRRKP